MVVVDTSIWIEHFRVGEPHLALLLTDGRVFIHPFIIGELACGNFRNRDKIFGYLSCLPLAPKVSDEEILFFIEHRRLMGKGIGYINVCLLASTFLANAKIWTKDTRLAKLAADINIHYQP